MWTRVFLLSTGRQESSLLLNVGFTKRYCLLSLGKLWRCGDGGWTLAMRIDGKTVCSFTIMEYHSCELSTGNTFLSSTFQKTYHYDFKLESDKYVYNLPGGKTGFDSKETKLPTHWNTLFSKICLGIKINQQLRFIFINKQVSSLHKLFPLNYR